MRARHRGSMLMEFVITMPILVFLVMFVLQLAYLQLAHECTAYAAFCAARSLRASNAVDSPRYAQKAAEVALAWFHPRGLAAGRGKQGQDGIEIPGWGKIPGSDTISDHVEVEVDPAMLAANLGGKASLASVTVFYDCPMMIPVVGEVMAWALREDRKKGGENEEAVFGWLPVTGREALKNAKMIKDGETFPFVTIKETCVLPMPYSTVRHPIRGYGTF